MIMSANTSITVKTHRFEFITKADAFAFYVAFVREYGEDQAFLLDSVTDTKKTYCSSMIGLFPFLTVRGKRRELSVRGDPAILSRTSYEGKQVIRDDLPVRLDNILHSFRVDADLPAYAFGYLGFFGYDSIRYFENAPSPIVSPHLKFPPLALHPFHAHKQP